MSPRLLPKSGALIGRVRAVAHSNRGVARGAWLAARVGTGALAAILLIFHAWLLWRQLDSGQILDPLTATKWATALVMFGGLVALRAGGLSPFRGRQALVVWTLVAMVHWSAASRLPAAMSADGPATAVSLILPAAEALTGLALALAALTRRGADPSYVRLALVHDVQHAHTLVGCRSDGWGRAPPLTA